MMILADLIITFIGKRHISKVDLTTCIIGFKLQGFGLIVNFNRQIQVFKDAVKQSQCTLNIHLNVEQLSDGEEKPALQVCKCNNTAEADRRVHGIVYNLRTCYKIDNSGRDRKEDANEHE